MSFGRLIHKPWKNYKLFKGTWDHRLAGLFECGVDYHGKSILDAGCNIGIIAYEIAKHRPSFIHGIDNYRRGISVARHIFQAVDVSSRFDVADLTNERKLRRLLQQRYEIVLLLSVWQNIRTSHGSVAADRVVSVLTEHCSGMFVAKTSEPIAHEFSAVMERHRYRIAYGSDPKGRLFTFVEQ